MCRVQKCPIVILVCWNGRKGLFILIFCKQMARWIITLVKFSNPLLWHMLSQPPTSRTVSIPSFSRLNWFSIRFLAYSFLVSHSSIALEKSTSDTRNSHFRPPRWLAYLTKFKPTTTGEQHSSRIYCERPPFSNSTIGCGMLLHHFLVTVICRLHILP